MKLRPGARSMQPIIPDSFRPPLGHCIGSSIGPYLFFFHDTPTTEIYTLSLHDALPIFAATAALDLHHRHCLVRQAPQEVGQHPRGEDRKSTRLNSSHRTISYAVFCLKKKKQKSKYLIKKKKKKNTKKQKK